jgi:hypothetical protein
MSGKHKASHELTRIRDPSCLGENTDADAESSDESEKPKKKRKQTPPKSEGEIKKE